MTPLELRAHGAVLAELLVAAEAGDIERVRSMVSLVHDLARGLVTEREVRTWLHAAEPAGGAAGWGADGAPLRAEGRKVRRTLAGKDERAP